MPPWAKEEYRRNKIQIEATGFTARGRRHGVLFRVRERWGAKVQRIVNGDKWKTGHVLEKFFYWWGCTVSSNPWKVYFGWAAEHFEGDSRNLEGMFLHNNLDTMYH